MQKIREYMPPNREWRYQKQTDPPTFGWARLVNNDTLKAEIQKRAGRAKEIIDNSHRYCNFKDGRVSLIILSCRRSNALKGLISSLKRYFSEIRDHKDVEKILVDNGSGPGLIEDARSENFFDKIIIHPDNLGMVSALRDAYSKAEGEYIIFLEDDFILDYSKPFISKSIDIFNEFPEIGIIRLKNQNNWWKPHRVIAPVRKTASGIEFWTWLPSEDGRLNGWCAGSVIFRKASYFAVGQLPEMRENLPRKKRLHQGYIYECVYGEEYNKMWLAAKIRRCYPFFQPNLNEESPGWIS